MEWCRMEGERSSECRKEEVRRRAGGDGGEDGWREQQRAGGSDWISTVCGQWTWGNEVRRLRDCKRGCVCTIKEKGKKKGCWLKSLQSLAMDIRVLHAIRSHLVIFHSFLYITQFFMGTTAVQSLSVTFSHGCYCGYFQSWHCGQQPEIVMSKK